MAFNAPYTPSIFHNVLANTYGDYVQTATFSGIHFQVGQFVQINESDHCFFEKESTEHNFTLDTPMQIDTMLVGTIATFDDNMCVAYITQACLLNCKLPTGDILSANCSLFTPCEKQEEML